MHLLKHKKAAFKFPDTQQLRSVKKSHCTIRQTYIRICNVCSMSGTVWM